MNFRLKVTLCMICLLSLLFGLGGSALISVSFQNSLSREEATAQSSYGSLLDTLRVISGLKALSGSGDAAEALSSLTERSASPWSAVRLVSGSDTLYSRGRAAGSLLDLTGSADSEQYALASFTDGQAAHYLQLTGSFTVGSDTLYLSVARDITPIYDTRSQQLRTYRRVFSVMLAVCAVLSWAAAYILTRPLFRLSRASREIASGNLSYRSGVKTGDEIGALARDFDDMAAKLEANVSELTASMRRQEQFVGSFTHELKTPMTSIIGYADLLRGGTLTPDEQADAANYIFSEGRRLERLSLTLLSIFSTDGQDVKLVSASPAGIIRDQVAHLRPVLQSQRVDLRCRCEDGACLLEPDLVRSLTYNLIDNARKAFEHGGCIAVTSRMTADGCVIAVGDNGRGIPPEALAHITEAFYRVDKSRSRAQGGAGLGLTLCAKIAQLHGGSIRFDSTVGRGTVVTVILKGGRP